MPISVTQGELMFNERVLANGHPPKKPTAEDLQRALFFNRIFHSNMCEVFAKYDDCGDIIDRYVELLRVSVSNLNDIVSKLMRTFPVTIRKCSDTVHDFERRLSLETHITDQLSMSRIDADFEWRNDWIYFIDIVTHNVFWIDPKKSLFEKSIFSTSTDGVFSCWRLDECISEHIKSVVGRSPIVVRLTNKDMGFAVTKVEYHYSGEEEKMVELVLRPLFPEAECILKNPWLYTDDLHMIIDRLVPKKDVPKSKHSPLDIDSIFKDAKMIEYPSHSFDVYLEFLQLLSADPRTHSIYISLYRIGDNPVIYYILRDAVRRGVKVYANIEINARGESINRFWTSEYKKAGIVCTNFAKGLYKFHAKLTLAVMADKRMIAQIGTGNYHTKTTSQYTDLSMITAEPEITSQVHKLFRWVCNLGRSKSFTPSFDSNFLVTQFNARDVLCKHIDHQGKLGKNGMIVIKCNRLDDPHINTCLYRAAVNGCRIELIIRGVCTFNPFELGVSENVTVRSVIWDRLEHTRLYYFGRNDPKIYMGSLDLSAGKLNNRIETMSRVLDIDLNVFLEEYIRKYLHNHYPTWTMTTDTLSGVKYVQS